LKSEDHRGVFELDEYYRIPTYPDHVSATSALTRLLDGLGFRFYWATEGLRPEDYAFRPAKDAMSIEELVMHVWELMNWVSGSALKKPYGEPKDGPAARREALRIIHGLRETLLAMSDEDLEKLSIRDKPFWNLINGPFSDALTHTGQINSFRRLAGNPVAGANVFLGEPPKAEKTG
jgi:hypothetical protein